MYPSDLSVLGIVTAGVKCEICSLYPSKQGQGCENAIIRVSLIPDDTECEPEIGPVEQHSQRRPSTLTCLQMQTSRQDDTVTIAVDKLANGILGNLSKMIAGPPFLLSSPMALDNKVSTELDRTVNRHHQVHVTFPNCLQTTPPPNPHPPHGPHYYRVLSTDKP